MAEELKFNSRDWFAVSSGGQTKLESRERSQTWEATQTALIVCDVWDYHHCLNAVRRLEEFGPRMNELIKFARSKGVTIIHSPSDCMPAYEEHPARQRAVAVPAAAKQPAEVKTWCSRIPREEQASYPIDQSDGGEDDDPEEHAAWAKKLRELGRNPNMPWKTQSSLIEIDRDRDFISDRGDEVWNILEAKNIQNVMLVGVHVNMCVLGRPFGLRQIVRNGKNAVLVRDMTDAMYNPARWPFVDHFTGTELVIQHIERYVCQTTTSDQFLGGKPFRFAKDSRPASLSTWQEKAFDAKLLPQTWQAVAVPNQWEKLTTDPVRVGWYRANLRLNDTWQKSPLQVQVNLPSQATTAWLNGKSLPQAGTDAAVFTLPAEGINWNDANLLVIRIAGREFLPPPVLTGVHSFTLKGRWEIRLGDDPSWSNIPLPAKFGASTDIYFQP